MKLSTVLFAASAAAAAQAEPISYEQYVADITRINEKVAKELWPFLRASVEKEAWPFALRGSDGATKEDWPFALPKDDPANKKEDWPFALPKDDQANKKQDWPFALPKDDQDAEAIQKLWPFIVGGTEVPVNTRQYVAGMRSSPDGRSFCGGSLIAPNWVLTAAHCASGITHVNVGTHFLSGTADGTAVKVARKIKHPKYTSASSSGYDFLLLELEKPVSYPPVALAKADGTDEPVGTTSTTLGWGTTSSGGTQSNVLLSVDVDIVSNEACKAKLSSINPSMICAGGLQDKDSCQGDSGGPLVVSQNGTDVLVGVVSWGRGCGLLGYPGVYARVSAGRDFIDKHVPKARWL